VARCIKLAERTAEGLAVLMPASMGGRYECGGAANGPYQAYMKRG
jgi:hypothetical protein